MTSRPNPGYIIKHRGFFDQKKLLSKIQGWLGKEGYFSNILFKEKSGISAKAYFIDITGSRTPSDYVKFELRILIRIADLRKVELIKDGKKIKTNEGSIQIDITPKSETDWQKKFSGAGKLGQALGSFLENYILKYKLSDYWDGQLAGEIAGLQSMIKEELGLEV